MPNSLRLLVDELRSAEDAAEAAKTGLEEKGLPFWCALVRKHCSHGIRKALIEGILTIVRCGGIEKEDTYVAALGACLRCDGEVPDTLAERLVSAMCDLGGRLEGLDHKSLMSPLKACGIHGFGATALAISNPFTTLARGFGACPRTSGRQFAFDALLLASEQCGVKVPEAASSWKKAHRLLKDPLACRSHFLFDKSVDTAWSTAMMGASKCYARSMMRVFFDLDDAASTVVVSHDFMDDSEDAVGDGDDAEPAGGAGFRSSATGY